MKLFYYRSNPLITDRSFIATLIIQYTSATMSRYYTVDPLNMSLDAIISQRDGQGSNNRRRNTPVSFAIRNNTQRRDQRQSNPYENRNNARRNPRVPTASTEYALKFLLNNQLAGTFIGNGGSSIRDMMDITEASIHISNNGDSYPGTKERVVYITGNAQSLNLAQSLIWEMIGQQTSANQEGGRKSAIWDPASAKASPGEYDDMQVYGRITIPASAGGLIVGRGGATVRSIAEESGVDISIDTKEDGESTQERVITLSGTCAGCMKGTSLIVAKLCENDPYSFVCNGTTYPKGKLQRARADSSSFGNDEYHDRSRTVSSMDKGLFDSKIKTGVCAETLSAHTTIELAVPDSTIGAILGVQVSFLLQ